MTTITIELDIQADGSIIASPNPAVVADGDSVIVHLRSNESELEKFDVEFPEGDDSPFAGQGGLRFDYPAKFCVGTVYTDADWPEGVRSYTYRVRAHSSPGGSEARAVLLRRPRPELATRSRAACPPPMSAPRAPIAINHNYFFGRAEATGIEQGGQQGRFSGLGPRGKHHDVIETTRATRIPIEDPTTTELIIKCLSVKDGALGVDIHVDGVYEGSVTPGSDPITIEVDPADPPSIEAIAVGSHRGRALLETTEKR